MDSTARACRAYCQGFSASKYPGGSWFSGLAVAALLALYLLYLLYLLYQLCSVAVVVYFRRDREKGAPWQTLIATILASLLISGVLWGVVSNFTSLIGGDATTATILLAVVPVAFLVGIAVDAWSARAVHR